MWLCLLPALLFGNLSVLAPLRLSDLGWSAAAIGGTYLVMAAIEASWAPILGRASDRYGRLPPAPRSPARVRGRDADPSLAAQPVAARGRHRLCRLRVRQLLDAGDVDDHRRGRSGRPRLRLCVRARQHRVGTGQAGGAALGGAIASFTSDAVPYLGLSALCLLTLLAVTRYQREPLHRPQPSGRAHRRRAPDQQRHRGPAKDPQLRG